MAKGKTKNTKQQGRKGSSRLKDLAANPAVADLAAAALVSAAAAIKTPPKGRAAEPAAQDDLAALARDGVRKGVSLWQLALDVGRQALDTLIGEPRPAAAPKAARKAAKPAAKTARKAAKPVAKTARKAAKPAAKAARAAAKPAARSARKSAKAAAKTVRKASPRGKPRAR